VDFPQSLRFLAGRGGAKAQALLLAAGRNRFRDAKTKKNRQCLSLDVFFACADGKLQLTIPAARREQRQRDI